MPSLLLRVVIILASLPRVAMLAIVDTAWATVAL